MTPYSTIQRTSIALTVAVFLIAASGCSDSLTSPNTRYPLASNPKAKPILDIIPLDGILVVPGRPFNTYATIKGAVTSSFAKAPYKGQYLIHLGLSVIAQILIVDDEKREFLVAGQSNDEVFVSEEGIALLEKVYDVKGSGIPLRFRIRFIITSDGIGLSGMNIEREHNPAGHGDIH